MARWMAGERVIVADEGGDRSPKIMGIVNVTPDSFSDGGRWAAAAAAVAHALSLVAEGADILDIGGESTRPGADPVPADEEIRRVIPVIQQLRAETVRPISIDTMKPEVARRALEAGASIINDVTGLSHPDMMALASETKAGVVIMHMAGTPQTMQLDPRYGDVTVEVLDYLAARVEAALAAGVAPERIAVDPGIGFGKTHEHNGLLLRNTRRFASLGCALLVGTSRKGFLGKMTGRPPGERATASAVSSLFAATQGADVLRVHDVGALADALKVWGALSDWPE